MRWTAGAALDLCCVLAFVVIGLLGHAGGVTAAGLASTAWPFLAGAVVGWAATGAWQRPAALVPTGVGVWLGTVAVGMVARALLGQGTATTFVVVTSVFFAATMLGWRAVVRWRAPASLTRQRPPAR